MKNLRKVLVGLIVAALVVLPLLAVAMSAPSGANTQIVRIADGPTPTPTMPGGGSGGNSGCHGQGC